MAYSVSGGTLTLTVDATNKSFKIPPAYGNFTLTVTNSSDTTQNYSSTQNAWQGNGGLSNPSNPVQLVLSSGTWTVTCNWQEITFASASANPPNMPAAGGTLNAAWWQAWDGNGTYQVTMPIMVGGPAGG